MTASIRNARISMELFCSDVTEHALSLLFDPIKNNAKRVGIKIKPRMGLKDLDETEKYLKSIVTSRSFGMNPTYYLDIEVKPEILFGTPSVARGINVTIGISPPAYLYIYAFSEGKIRGINTKNLVEKLNLTENLTFKVLDELGLVSPCMDKFNYRLIVWRVQSSSSKIRNLSFWRKNLKNFVSNDLFPLKEESLEEYMAKYVFPNGDTIVGIPAPCLVHEFACSQNPDLAFRLFAIDTEDPEDTRMSMFLFGLDEVMSTALTTLSLSSEAESLQQKLGKVEKDFDEVVQQLSRNTKASSVFVRTEEVESGLWKLNKEYSRFLEEEYLRKLVKTRGLADLLKNTMKTISEQDSADFGLIPEFESILEYGLERLASVASILTTRIKNLNGSFSSLKTTLTTRVQIGLERRNISIQKAIGLLQIIAVAMFSFELLKYFYPFMNDLEHILAYILALSLPSISGYWIFRKLVRVGSRL